MNEPISRVERAVTFRLKINLELSLVKSWDMSMPIKIHNLLQDMNAYAATLPSEEREWLVDYITTSTRHEFFTRAKKWPSSRKKTYYRIVWSDEKGFELKF